MSDLVTKFTPKVQISDFSHGVEIEEKFYIAGMEGASLSCVSGIEYIIYGNIYVDRIEKVKHRIRVPKLLNPFHKEEICDESRVREFKQRVGIYSEPSIGFLESALRGLFNEGGLLFIKRDSAEKLILPIWEYYQPIIDSANIELQEAKKILRQS